MGVPAALCLTTGTRTRGWELCDLQCSIPGGSQHHTATADTESESLVDCAQKVFTPREASGLQSAG